jgi:hypothetical protein
MIPIQPGDTLIQIAGDEWDAVRHERDLRHWLRLSERLRDGSVRYAFGRTEHGEDVIPAHPRESDDRIRRRRALTRVTSYVSAIAGHYIAHIWRRPQSRGVNGVDIPREAQHIIDDADGTGIALTELMRRVTRRAFVEQRRYLLVDRTDRYVIRDIDADHVWRADALPSGVVRQAAVRMADVDGRYFLWNIDDRQSQRAWLDDAGEQVTAVEPARPHGYGGCPLVQFGQTPAIIADVADCQRRIALIDSLLVTDLENNAVTWYIGSGIPDPAAMPKLVKSANAIVAFQSPEARIAAISGDDTVSQRLSREREEARAELYQIAKVQPTSAEPGQAESGLARQYRFVDAEVELSALADAAEMAENACWRLIARAMAAREPVTADYPDDFAPTDIAGRIARADAVQRARLPDEIKAAEISELIDDVFPGLDSELIAGTWLERLRSEDDRQREYGLT